MEFMVRIVKHYLIIFAFLFFGFLLYNYEVSVERFLYTQKVALTCAPMTAKSVVRGFQEEGSMDVYSSPSGGPSTEYLDFLSWLGSNSTFYEISQELSTGFSEGTNPMNYAIPFVDQTKLQEAFNTAYNEQLSLFTSNDFCEITSIQGRVLSVSKTFESFSSNHSIWGESSSFYTNTAGHTQIYDYDNYVNYTIRFEVEITCNLRFGITNISAGSQPIKVPFTITYNLIN